MANAIGIDLGTTNTVAAEVQLGLSEPITIQTRNYGSLTRSALAYDKGDWKVGAEVEQLGRYAPECVISSTKRFIGLSYDDQRIRHDKKALNRNPLRPRVVEPPTGESGVRFRFYPEGAPPIDLSPVDVATLILKQVKQDAEQATGNAVTRAVITAPAYFDAARIEATRQAGEAAGLQVQRIISEPLAAALAYGMKLDSAAAETILVFDMGGGTLDVTVCAVGKNDCLELAKDGDNHLGGDDLDTCLRQLVLKKLRDASGIDFIAPGSADAETLQRLDFDLRIACRGEKERLSTADEVTMLNAVRLHPKSGPGTERVKITRAEFEDSIRDFVDRSMLIARQALDKASCSASDINKVLLVGGSTYVPMIRERLRALFGNEKVRIDVNPMEAVAKGAALLAASLPNLILCPQCRTDQPSDATSCPKCGVAFTMSSVATLPTPIGPHLQVVSTTARTMSVKTDQGNLVPVFKGGTQYSPTEGNSLAKARETFRLSVSGARALRVEFYEGDSQRADDSLSAYYADTVVYGLPADTRQGEEVILEATLNGDGTLAGTVTFRATPYPFIASPSRWRGDLVDQCERARLKLPNIHDSAARAQLERAIEHAEDVAINRTSDGRAGRAAGMALSNAIDECPLPGSLGHSPEMEKLSLALAIAGALFEYGGDWVDLLPKVTAAPLRDALLRESQLLTTLRSAVVDGRQIEAHNDFSLAERAADRIDSLMHASELLFPLTYARIVSEYSVENGHKRGPGGLLSQPEWEGLRQTTGAQSQRLPVSSAGGTQEQHARDIGALLEQMKVTIISNPPLFYAQYQRVMQLVDAFYSSHA